MEAFGAAASAIALAQTAISLARALNSYAGAVSDSVDDVVVIADDISDTYGNLQQLATVLEKNEKTRILNEAAVSNAQRCVVRSEVLLKRLRKLFEKSGASVDANRVEAEHIDISRFRRGVWIIYKSEFELRRAELHHIKADISLIYLTYLTMASSSNDGEKQQARDQMKLVYAKRNVLDKKLKKARRRRTQDVQGQRRKRPYDHYSSAQVPYTQSGRYVGVDDDEDDDDDGAAIVYAKIEDLYNEFELWLARKEEKDRQVATEREDIEKGAVQLYLKQQEEKALRVQSDTKKLRDTLTQHGLPPQRIEQIIKDAYPQASAPPQDSLGAPPGTIQSAVQNNRLSPRPPSGASSWFRRSSARPDRDAASQTSHDLPDVLRDSSAPGGVAQLKALYFQRVNIAPTRYDIVKLEVAVPDYRLMPKLLSSSLQISQQSSVSNFLQGFADVPEDYRYHITKELEGLQDGGESTWMVLQVEATRSKQRARLLSRKRKEDVVGVYVVLRKMTDPDIFVNPDKYSSGIDPSDPAAQMVGAAVPVEADPASPVNIVLREPRSELQLGSKFRPEYANVYVDKDESKENERNLVYASHSRNRGETSPGPGAQSQRRTRFSENVQLLGDRRGPGYRTTHPKRDTYYGIESDDEWARYEVPPPNPRARDRNRVRIHLPDSRDEARWSPGGPGRAARSRAAPMEMGMTPGVSSEVAERLARLRILEEEGKRREEQERIEQQLRMKELHIRELEAERMERLRFLEGQSRRVEPEAERLERLERWEEQRRREKLEAELRALEERQRRATRAPVEKEAPVIIQMPHPSRRRSSFSRAAPQRDYIPVAPGPPSSPSLGDSGSDRRGRKIRPRHRIEIYTSSDSGLDRRGRKFRPRRTINISDSDESLDRSYSRRRPIRIHHDRGVHLRKYYESGSSSPVLSAVDDHADFLAKPPGRSMTADDAVENLLVKWTNPIAVATATAADKNGETHEDADQGSPVRPNGNVNANANPVPGPRITEIESADEDQDQDHGRHEPDKGASEASFGR